MGDALMDAGRRYPGCGTEESLPWVSIGLPTYNRPDALERCLASLVKQTYPNLEIIVSDNASPDPKVAAICKHYADTDARVRYVRQANNIGATQNFFYVLEASTADFFMWTSDDHEFEPHHVSTIMAGHCSGDYGFVSSNWRFHNPDNSPVPMRPMPTNVFAGPKWVTLCRFLTLDHWAYAKANFYYSIFKKEALTQTHQYDVTMDIGSDHVVIAETLSQYGGKFINNITWGRYLDSTLTQAHIEKPYKLSDTVYGWVNAILPNHPSKRIDDVWGYTHAMTTICNKAYPHWWQWPVRLLLQGINLFNQLRVMQLFYV